MAPIDDARVSVHDLDGDELADYIAAHVAEWGFPPMAGGDDGDDDADADGDDDGEDEEDADADDAGDNDQDGDDDGKADEGTKKKPKETYTRAEYEELQRRSRRWERRAKAKKGAAGKDDGDDKGTKKPAKKDDGEVDVEQIKADARAEAKAESDKVVRSARLEGAVSRRAAKTFADPDDALVHLKAAIDNGDLDHEDIFDEDGKVQTDALDDALTDILERKPHLAAGKSGGSGGGGRSGGGSGAGRGSGGGKSREDKSVADIDKELRAAK